MCKKLTYFMSLVLLLGVGNVSAELIARYEFDTDVSDIAGYAGGPFDGTLLGTAQVADGYLVLDGVGDTSAEVPAFNLNTNTATLSAWVRADKNPQQDDDNQQPFTGIIFSHGASTISGLNFEFDNQLGYHWNDAYWSFQSGLFVPQDTWTFVAVVVDPDKATLYMQPEGGSMSTSVSEGVHDVEAWDSVTWLGAATFSQPRKMVGLIDDARIYGRALNADEIASIVPEPATISLLALGGLGFLTMRRRRNSL